MDDLVRDAARRRPDHPALIADSGTLTWAELDTRVDAAAGRLIGLADPGDRVALMLGNTVGFAVSFFGALRAGMVAVPLNPGYTADELGHALSDSGAPVVVAEGGVRDRLPGAVPPVFEPVSPMPRLPEPDPGRLAVLLYTSGTSGRPKGAMLTLGALVANHEQIAQIEPPIVGPDDVVLLAVPFFHAYGLNSGLGTVAYHGATGVLVDRFDPGASLAAIERHGVTAILGVPSMYVAWSRQESAAASLARVRAAVCGAAPFEETDEARFTEVTGKTTIIGYGLTEASPVLTTTARSDRPKSGSIGRPIPGVSLMLRAADGTVLWRDGETEPETDTAEMDLDIADVAGTDPGEIVVRGANLFSGYWPDGHDAPDPDGWWATGDIAYADVDGDLVLVDRIGELILVNGFNVYPAEIERVLADHPGVTEAAVVAVRDPDTGQAPHAYVVPNGDPPVTSQGLIAYCATRLARFKVPATLDLVRELPHSAVGKVRKSALR